MPCANGLRRMGFAAARSSTPPARLLAHVLMLAQAAALPDPDETARQLLVLIDGAIAVALVTGALSITDSAERAAAALLPASA
ncbi:hypothetical protein G6F63_016318 [Rhizopus arrhizus]|nr:hypothetical protein G6F63_016318 [Rhizopus arrhizus]